MTFEEHFNSAVIEAVGAVGGRSMNELYQTDQISAADVLAYAATAVIADLLQEIIDLLKARK